MAGSDRHVAQRNAGSAFAIRAFSAALIYASHIFLARWMGSFEFGIYVYVATWVLLIGDLAPLGLATVAQTFIPQYRQTQAVALLRGFLSGSRWIAFAAATILAVLCGGAIKLSETWLEQYWVIPLYLACLSVPFYALANMLDGIANSFGWIRLALIPPYLLRPLLIVAFIAGAYLLGIPGTAANAMMAAVAATWLAAMIQLALVNRKLASVMAPGPTSHDTKNWLSTSFPVFVTRGFYTLLAYTDILVLQMVRPPNEIGAYYAATKALALVAFVNFAVGRAVAYKFTEYRAAGDSAALAAFVAHATRLTFWPSLVGTIVILALGKPFLWLFGPDFTSAYPLLFVLALGPLARASVGPADRLLNTLGQQRFCALIYAVAFALCLLGCLLLIPKLGTVGAAIATSSAMIVESGLLFWAARRRLGLHIFVWGGSAPDTARPT